MFDHKMDTIFLRSPLATFFDVDRVNVRDLSSGDLAFIGVPSDSTHTSRIGTRFGPRAIRHETSRLIHRLEQEGKDGLVDTRSGESCVLSTEPRVFDLGDIQTYPLDVNQTTRSIADQVRKVVERGALPFAIGGDHYNSFPACLGVSEALLERDPNIRFGYIQIDGHLDFGDKLAAWGELNHATNARRCSELPNIIRENMVWIGIAGWVDGDDVAEIEKFGGLIISAEQLHEMGAKEAARLAIRHALKNCDLVYLTIDVDALDSGFLPGTGSIVHSEIDCRQYLELLEAFAEMPLCGIDMVEVSPPLDPSGRSEVIAAAFLFEILQKRFITESGK